MQRSIFERDRARFNKRRKEIRSKSTFIDFIFSVFMLSAVIAVYVVLVFMVCGFINR